MEKKIKASDYIVHELSKCGVTVVFGYMGGMITHLVDSISRKQPMKFIQVYHEQTAAFAASGYARDKKCLGVAVATSGPGATNLITGIADAFFDSIPVLFITGQVNIKDYKYDIPLRQLGFQEANIVDMVKPITKYAKLIDNIKDLPHELANAIQLATSERMGPVLLDLPFNIQQEMINLDLMELEQNKQSSNLYSNNLKTLVHDIAPDVLLVHGVVHHFPLSPTYLSIHQGTINKLKNDNHLPEVELVLSKFQQAKRPLVLIGGGVALANAENDLDVFISTNKLPFLSSLLGKSVCDERANNYIGTIGSYGNRCANMAIAATDLLLVCGARLDSRQTGNSIASFAKNAEIIHIDIDKNVLEFNRIKHKINLTT